MKNLILFASLSLLVATSSGEAELRKSPLTKGMAAKDVVAKWGQPDEIQEYETKREVVWRYGKKDSVKIRESKVVSWTMNGQTSGDAERLAREMLAASERREVESQAPVPNETRELVSEIAREIPAGADAPYVEPPALDPATNTAIIPPAPAGVPQQPPAAGGLYANPPGGFQPYVATDEE
jgi:hypothetical protein